jgi:hypothetical protein
MEDSKASSLGSVYAANRAPAIINYHENNKSIIQDQGIGRVFAEYKDKIVIIDGEHKKEHEYLIPKTKVDRYGDNEVYLDISDTSLKQFEI